MKHSAPSAYRSAAQRWQALVARDTRADGSFVYAVATTGIYCRPGCPSRLAKRENVAFHDTPAEAENAGFRACQRCHPASSSRDERHAQAIAKACRLIEGSEETPDLDQLAQAADLSRFHFHRLFKKIVGLTPRQYSAAQRAQRVRSQLRARPSVTEAIYEAGFSSSSRFYERSQETLGMTPSEFRKGGKGVAISYSIAPCPLGHVLVAGTERGICAVTLGGDPEALAAELHASFPQATIEREDRAFREAVQTLVGHLRDPAQPLDLPLDIQGTAFQQQVWQALRLIPAGQTASYTEIAQRIGRPSAVRAVARACATNPFALVVPCHRVIGVTGKLSGYRWGLERKQKLLEKEARVAA